MANTIPTAKDLVEKARKIADQAKKLQSSITTASGAVVGGPAQSRPPVKPSPPGNA